MENYELSNIGLILDDKIKENELAQGLAVREQSFLPEQHTEGRTMGTKKTVEKKRALEKIVSLTVFLLERVTNCHFVLVE